MNPRRSQRVNINGEALDEQMPIVLLVDDEVAVRDVLAWVIQGAGYTPLTAGGAEGFRASHSGFDEVTANRVQGATEPSTPRARAMARLSRA